MTACGDHASPLFLYFQCQFQYILNTSIKHLERSIYNLKLFFEQITIMLWNLGQNVYYCVWFLDCLDTIVLVWCVFFSWNDLIICVGLWVLFFKVVIAIWTLNIGYMLILSIDFWFMDYVWVGVDSFELLCYLNEVCKINKFRVGFMDVVWFWVDESFLPPCFLFKRGFFVSFCCVFSSPHLTWEYIKKRYPNT
jgi:hypothetical protein